MGNEVSLPPINGSTPSQTMAINQIISELNSIFASSSQTPQYLLSFATQLKTSIVTLQTAVQLLQDDTPSSQAQLTALQGAVDNITSTLNTYITTNNNSVSNISNTLASAVNTLNNLVTSIGSVNVIDLASDVATISSQLSNIITSLNNKVDKTTTVNGRPLNTNIILTPSDLGLGNVDNTSDQDKPISTAVQAALNQKVTQGAPISAGSVGLSSSVPVITYASNGLITAASNISIAISPNQAGLSNVPNVDATKASNVSIDQPITANATNINQGDTVLIALSKLQNQQSSKIQKVSGSVLDKIATFDSAGAVKSSGCAFNDLGTSSTDILSAASVITKINNAITGVLNLRGGYTLSGTSYPSTGGSGVAGAIMKGDLWYVNGSGTVGSTAVNSGDAIIALIDSPAQLNANWTIVQGALSYTPENQANKENSTLAVSAVLYPTTGLVKSYVDTGLATKEPSISSGTSTQYWKGDKTWATLDKTAVGLSGVTNDAQLKRAANDLNSFPLKATPTATDVLIIEDSQDVYNKKKISIDSLPVTTSLNSTLNGFVPTSRTINAHPLTANLTLTPTDLGLGNVDNTTDALKPVSIATANALSSKVDKINLPVPVTVGSGTKIPVISYNIQGQITSSSEADVAVTKADVGLGNVLNVDTTNLANTSIQGSFTTANLAVVTGDSGKVAIQKLQGQADNKLNKISSPTAGRILVSDIGGNAVESNKSFNDATTTSLNILSAAEVQARIDAVVAAGMVRYIGAFTPVLAATYPSSTASAGDLWSVAAAGTIGSTAVKTGDAVIALIDNPSNTPSNWGIIQGCLGYTAEDQANKETTITPSSNVKYPTSKAVADYVTAELGSFSGLPSGGTTSQYLRGDQTWATLDKTAVGLSNVTNDAQIKRSPDFSTLPAVTSLAAADTFVFEDASNSSAKSYITFNNLVSNINPPLTASRAVQSDGSGVVSASTTTATELSYLSGVTSAVQTQLNSKLDNPVASFSAVATPATPAVGTTKVYAKNDGGVYKLSSDGIEVNLGSVTVSGVTNGLLTRSSGGQPQNSGVQITTDSTFTSASDSYVPSQKAVADYLASQLIMNAKDGVEAVSNTSISVSGSGVLTTTANGALTVDGYALQLNDSVLLIAQSTASQNGIYTVTTQGTVSTPTVLTRRSDYNSPAEMKIGSVINVINGTTYGGTLFYQTSAVTTLETDPVSYSMINVGIGNLRVTNNLSELTSSAATARSNISAAQSGANTDITSILLNNTGLNVKCLSGSNAMALVNNNTYTANRSLFLTTGDQNTTLTLPATTASVSGVNTGDETQSSIISKVGNASASNTGVLTSSDWTTFNAKVPSTRTVNGHALSSDVTVTAADVGLGNVDNTSDLNKPISSATQTALNAKEATANKGQANGYASLDGTTKIPLAQLPSLALSNLSDVLFT